MTNEPVWEAATALLRSSALYRRLLQGGRATRLPGAAAAWVMTLVAEDLRRPVLVVTPHEPAALSWVESARFAGADVTFFPVSGLTPYQAAEAALSERVQQVVALEAWVSGDATMMVCTPQALFQRLPMAASLTARAIELRPGAELPMEQLAASLVDAGYHRTELASEVGDFAVRGGVFDVFAAGPIAAVRLDYFGDTIEAIRPFDVASQLSQGQLEVASIVPLTLFGASMSQAERLVDLLSEQLDALGYEGRQDLESLRSRGHFAGWMALLPLLEPQTRSLATVTAESPIIVVVEPQELLAAAGAHSQQLVTDQGIAGEDGRFAPAPETVEWPLATVVELIDGATIALDALATGPEVIDFAASETDLFIRQLPRFPRQIETARSRGERVVLVVDDDRREHAEAFLEERSIRDDVTLIGGELQRGFHLPAAGLVVFGEAQLFVDVGPPTRRRHATIDPFVSGLRDLKVGEYVVHSEHGIGRFITLRNLSSGDDGAAPLPSSLAAMEVSRATSAEVMEIEYADQRRLLLPMSRLDLIERYSGIEGVAPRLDRLGGSSWRRTMDRVRAGMRRLAVDLRRLYAERQLQRAPPMPEDSDLQRQFEAAFEHEETLDQLEATAAIKRDMQLERPMDRLLCGDVGFGKTEVAMRAAFKAVDAGYQVVVLAPTTILADQHLETFRDRLRDFPVNVDMISRFRTQAEIRQVIEAARQGKVDILIGTHRVLSQDIQLPRVALLIVDEEQRFGVAQKERFKELRKDIHVLAMSATPVPRTLQLSLAGVRDLSTIETPPRGRMAVETAIVPYNRALVREAIEFELARGGQVYYVYNNVEGIETMLESLREIVPQARLTVGHGQMDERQLSRRMHAFKRGEYDVLLATTIIENGIDIPSVNTMLIHRADRFGLAQLYQLRGRVGRSDKLAYCYLLVSPTKGLSTVARRRLSAIREFTELGAGFRLAARDLEIRGAGNLLGAEQSGHMASVGIETYLKMLDETVRELQGETIKEEVSTAIDLPISMSIPTDYVGDANLRMELYRRAARGSAPRAEFLEELTDRFGPPPDEVHRLLDVVELKRLAERLRVQSISSRGRSLNIRLRQDTVIVVEDLVRLVSERDDLAFSPSGVLRIDNVDPATMVDSAWELLTALVGS